jgi:choline kinase
LRWCGVEDVTVVVGFEADRVRRACGSGVRFIENVEFSDTNSLYSLWLARPLLQDMVVIMNCDVLFHPTLLLDLLTAGHDDALLISYPEAEAPPFGREEMKVCVRQGRVLEMSKELPPDRTDGENVGIVRFSRRGARRLSAILDDLVAKGCTREWAPRAFAAYAQEHPLHAIGTRGLPWIEIDTADDYADAARTVFPAIRPALDGAAPLLRRGA